MRLNVLVPLAALALSAAPAPLQVRTCTDEAEAVLAILDLRAAGRAPGEAHWRALFGSEGFRGLKAREEGMGRRYEEAPFRDYVNSEALLARREALRSALEAWRRLDYEGAAARANAFLPRPLPDAITVHLVLKPRPNWFVVDAGTRPTMFLALDPGMAPRYIEDVVAHELHHVGCYPLLDRKSPFPEGAKGRLAQARAGLAPFNEGFAMLVQAGAWNRHPLAHGRPEEKSRWDQGCARFAEHRAALEAFLQDLRAGRLEPGPARSRGQALFGPDLGPWYTVGWRMAALVEERFGRARLLACMEDLGLFLASYNEAAPGAGLPLWETALLKDLRGL